jgi:hypothetical protein
VFILVASSIYEACKYFTLFQKTLLKDRCAVVTSYNPMARDITLEDSLDITWLRDESLEDTDNLPDPAILAAEIVEDLQAALDQFAQIAADLAKNAPA